MRFDTVLIDIDDTLFDFRKSSYQALVKAFSEIGFSFGEQEMREYEVFNNQMWKSFELGEIETALYSVEGLHDAVCFYDAMRDKIVCVYAGNLDTNTLAKALRTALPKYMLPNVYEKLEALPHNANGKLDRAALKERFLHAES